MDAPDSAPVSRRGFLKAAAVVLPTVRASAAQSAWTTSRSDAIGKLIADEVAKAAVPGASIAVVANGKLVWARGFGFADLEHRAPATPQTVFRIASISKPLTATAAMQLVERGTFALDAPVQQYVPTFPLKQWPISIRNLLQHTAGIRHYRPDEDVNRRRYTSVTEACKQFQDDQLLFEPGTNFRYTSLGFVLLGAAIEAAAGVPYAEYVRSNILEPAGMTATRPDDPDPVIANRARGYRRDAAGNTVNAVWVDQSNKLPAGGWLSTVEDLARFAIAIEENRLVRPDTRAAMWERVRTSDGREMDYAKGWMARYEDGALAGVGHGGNQQGAMAAFNIEPHKKIATVILMNTESYREIWQLSGRLSKLAS